MHYEDGVREQTFLEPDGKPVLQRVVALEKDGSIASIRYKLPDGANAQGGSDLYRIVRGTVPMGGEKHVTTIWDDHGNWTEKREIFQPRVGPSTTVFVYRRMITYR